MPIELLPVVSWIKQDYSASYLDSLQQILSSFHGLAHNLLMRHAPPERSDREPRELVLQALLALQREIFDQYLPPLDRNRTRSVGGLWHDWGLKSMKLLLDNGQVFQLSPLPEGNGALQEREIGGVAYKFTFYSNDTEGQRRKWLYKMMEEEARGEKRKLARRESETQFEEHWDAEDDGQMAGSIDAGMKLKEWFAVTDSGDWKLVFGAAKGDSEAVRQARSNAKRRVLAAFNILFHPLPSGGSRPFRDRLRRAKDGERRTILDEYLTRYPGEGKKRGG